MAADVALEGSVRELEKRLAAAVDGHPPLTLQKIIIAIRGLGLPRRWGGR